MRMAILTSKTDGGVTAYTLDGVGNITASTDALGNTTTYTYDKMYNMTSGTDPKGNQISYVYDKNYQQVKQASFLQKEVITYKYDSMGRVIEESNKDFGTKLYEYDKAGNLKKYIPMEMEMQPYQILILLDRCFSPKMQLVI